MTPPPDWQPWTRQDGESPLDFELFSHFLMLSAPREVATISARVAVKRLSHAHVVDLSYRWYWHERAQLWDDHLAAIRIKKTEEITAETAADVAKRHSAALKKMLRLAEVEFGKRLDIALRNDALGEITANELTKMVSAGVRLERLVMGDSTANIATPDLSRLSVEDLRRMREIQDKAGIR